eukprot:1496330-Rhodomonas_salina.1
MVGPKGKRKPCPREGKLAANLEVVVAWDVELFDVVIRATHDSLLERIEQSHGQGQASRLLNFVFHGKLAVRVHEPNNEHSNNAGPDNDDGQPERQAVQNFACALLCNLAHEIAPCVSITNLRRPQIVHPLNHVVRDVSHITNLTPRIRHALPADLTVSPTLALHLVLGAPRATSGLLGSLLGIGHCCRSVTLHGGCVRSPTWPGALSVRAYLESFSRYDRLSNSI